MILPEASPTTQRYWDAARAHRLELPRCQHCGAWHHPLEPECGCDRPEVVWAAASGGATLVSSTVVRRAAHPSVADEVPYTVMLVRLTEGPMLVSSLPGERADLTIGADLQVEFDDVTAEVTLPRFVPRRAALG